MKSSRASEEQASHAPADALPVVQNVELVDELIHAVAGFSDGSQIRHQTHVITLLQGETHEQKHFSRCVMIRNQSSYSVVKRCSDSQRLRHSHHRSLS